jgi:phospholipid/cholesterol/gamma-HCH transport system permease protein
MTPLKSIHAIANSMGSATLKCVRYAGGLGLLCVDATRESWVNLVTNPTRFSRQALVTQMVRVGVRSVPIVLLVQGFIGVILALQMAPPLKPWGQEAMIANIIGVAGFRMLGPIITGIVISGFAGASIAAELGTMVVSEEIEALEAMAMKPVRYLVVPRLVATVIMMVFLTIIADVIIAVGGYVAALLTLGPDVYMGYFERMQNQLRYRDLITGLIQAAVFGLLIGLIACYSGLRVRGGASGVGNATTLTVVLSIVAIIFASLVFTIVFFSLGI